MCVQKLVTMGYTPQIDIFGGTWWWASGLGGTEPISSTWCLGPMEWGWLCQAVPLARMDSTCERRCCCRFLDAFRQYHIGTRQGQEGSTGSTGYGSSGPRTWIHWLPRLLWAPWARPSWSFGSTWSGSSLGFGGSTSFQSATDCSTEWFEWALSLPFLHRLSEGSLLWILPSYPCR